MSKYQRFVVAFDSHGDVIDRSVERVFFEFVKHFKPTIRIHGGDAFDLRALRRGATDEEKCDGTKADIEAGVDFLKRLDPQVFIRGNHDERLIDAATNHLNGVIRSACVQLVDYIHDAIPKTKQLPYDKRQGVYKLGHLRIIHGFFSGMNAAKRSAEVYGSVLCGHGHSIDHVVIPGIERRMGRMCGALCSLDHSYNRAHANTLRHAHGFAYGLLFPDGTYRVYQAEEINGVWIFPSEFTEIRQ